MVKMLPIESITIVHGVSGPDEVFLDTNLPEPEYPFTGKASLKLRVAKGSGLRYVTEHFPGVSITIVEKGYFREEHGDRS